MQFQCRNDITTCSKVCSMTQGGQSQVTKHKIVGNREEGKYEKACHYALNIRRDKRRQNDKGNPNPKADGKDNPFV